MILSDSGLPVDVKMKVFNPLIPGDAEASGIPVAVPALTGFYYSAIENSMQMSPRTGKWFWSNGYAWGSAEKKTGNNYNVSVKVMHGELALKTFGLENTGTFKMTNKSILKSGDVIDREI